MCFFMDPPELLKSFILMWSAYPASASLIHKSKRIVAVNAACLAGGRYPGMFCFQWGPSEKHRGCLAGKVLRDGQPCHKEIFEEDGFYRLYWLPVEGYPDYYLHFTTEIIYPSKHLQHINHIAGGCDES